MVGFLFGLVAGLAMYLAVRVLLIGWFTVQQNERAVITSFGRAQRIESRTTLDSPIAEHLSEEHRARYHYPQVRVIGPGGPYFKWPWQRVHRVNVAIQTVNTAYDPDAPTANYNNTMLDAVTKDQLNIGIRGQLRFRVSEKNLYAYLFGVRQPIAHVMGYFVSILRERIATFRAPEGGTAESLKEVVDADSLAIEGISINDLRKNLNQVNLDMDRECLSSAARYGVVLDASLITGMDPPDEIESALAAINTAHNEVSAEISIARALADQKIELDLLPRAKRIIGEVRS